jgi:hypothetical protein
MPPHLIVHADWGTHPAKRWCAEARLDGNRFVLSAPTPVGPLDDFVPGLLAREDAPTVLIGFDFPIGIPASYGDRVNAPDFVDFLIRLGSPPYDRFFSVARVPDEISLWRPFYPHRPGGTKQIHLLDALGLTTADDLLRQCERASNHRGRASPLFWTLGAKQVGKAAICGWRDVLRPALQKSRERIAIWPFDGTLSSLLDTVPCVIAETYPAEACVQLGLPSPGNGWSKAVQLDRAVKCRNILKRAEAEDIVIPPAVRCLLEEGFGSGRDGEDQFDAFVGLVAMVRVATGARAEGMPGALSRSIEGWILGQADGAILPGGLRPAPALSTRQREAQRSWSTAACQAAAAGRIPDC